MRLAVVWMLVVASCAEQEDNYMPDPSAPGAAGTIALAPGVSTDGFAVLAIRLTPDSGEAEKFQDLAVPAAWPTMFFIGGGIGRSTTMDLTVRTWLGERQFETGPAPGAPHAELAVTLCDEASRCSVIPGLALELAP